MNPEIETCKNPFRKRRCDSTDIELYIIYKGKKCPICAECWKKIANSDEEWSSECEQDDPIEVVEKVIKKRHEVLKKLNRGSKKCHE